MPKSPVPEKKWEQRWHDGVIDLLESMLRGLGTELTVESHRGKARGADMVIRGRRSPSQVINVEVQMHPSGKEFLQVMDRWGERHTKALATFIVCPMALLPTLARRVEGHRLLGHTEGIYFFGDAPEQLTLLCACAFNLVRAYK